MAIGLALKSAFYVSAGSVILLAQLTLTSEASQGAQGYIGGFLTSVKTLLTDRDFLNWLFEFALTLVCLACGVVLLRGPRLAVKGIRRLIA
jgi:hypothetical protein